MGSRFKDDLKATGLYSFFESYRNEIIEAGSKPEAALKECVKYFTPLIEEEKEKQAEKTLGEEGSDLNCCPGDDSSEPLPADLPKDLTKSFLDKSAGIVTSIAWVAKVLELPKRQVKQDEAPSPEAYGLYKSYSRSNERRDEFWDKVFTKLIPNRAQLEDDKPQDVDGASIINTAEKLLKMRDYAEGVA